MSKKLLALVGLTALLTLIASLGAFPASPAAALSGPFGDTSFGVVLTNSLQSFDADGNGPPYSAAGDKPVSSGYTFSIRSTAPFFPASNTMTVTFPGGTDLSAASLDGSNYRVWDPTDRAFQAASNVAVDTATNPSAPTLTLTFGNLVAPLAADTNITVNITEGANIRNPASPSETLQLNVTINGSSDVTVATSERYAVGPSVTAGPRRPGAQANFTITFIASNDIPAESGTITISFEEEFSVPAGGSIVPANVILVTDRITNVNGTAQPNNAVRLTRSPVVDQAAGPQADRRSVRLTVPDMDRTEGAIGTQGIAAGATVTVVFDPSAGLRNPTEGASGFQRNDPRRYAVRVRTTDASGRDLEANDRVAYLHTPRELSLDTNEAAEGERVVVVGRGYKTGTTAVLFVDTNGDGMKQTTELELGSTLVGAGDTFTTSLAVGTPMLAGTAGNNIQAVDGLGNSACDFAIGPGSEGLCVAQGRVLRLKSNLQISPGAASIGSRVNVTLKNWSATGVPVESVTLGGVPVSFTPTVIPASGEVTLTVTIPNGVPNGLQSFRVAAGGASADYRFLVGGAALNLLVPRAVPNQDLTISGSGFTAGTNVKICQSAISLGAVPVTLREGSVAGTGQPCPAGVNFVNVTSGGTFVTTVVVPINSATLTQGTHELQVTDTSGRRGSAFLEIPGRQLTLDHPVSGVRTPLTITGTGFPADNYSTSTPQITLEYDCGNNCRRTATANPDTTGSFKVVMDVPRQANIPSTNTIRALIAGQTTVTTITHRVPSASIEVDRTSGFAGSLITITGTGFRPFTALSSVQIGGARISGGRTFTTDAAGRFEADKLVVPGLDSGVYSVLVQVGSSNDQTTANTTFEIIPDAPAPTPVQRTPAAQAFSVMGDNLVRVFSFNNQGKSWGFYDPRPEAAPVNTIVEVVSGEAYWVKVKSDQLVTLNGRQQELTCRNASTPLEDCWNIIVW